MTVGGTDQIRRCRGPERLHKLGRRFALIALLAMPSLTAVDAATTPAGKLDLVEFQSGPFPFHGINAGLNRPFLDINANGRLGHDSVRGGVYWEDPTYQDARSLLFIPAGFSLKRPGVMIVFFHGNQATLSRDVAARQAVP